MTFEELVPKLLEKLEDGNGLKSYWPIPSERDPAKHAGMLSRGWTIGEKGHYVKDSFTIPQRILFVKAIIGFMRDKTLCATLFLKGAPEAVSGQYITRGMWLAEALGECLTPYTGRHAELPPIVDQILAESGVALDEVFELLNEARGGQVHSLREAGFLSEAIKTASLMRQVVQ